MDERGNIYLSESPEPDDVERLRRRLAEADGEQRVNLEKRMRALTEPANREAALHPATAALLSYFDYHHLPPELQNVSAPFCQLAYLLASREDLDGPELTVGLRKLLEAKDCLVRARLATMDLG